MNIPTIADFEYLRSSLVEIRTVESDTYTYIGKTTAGNYNNVNEPVWQIFRFDSTSGEGLQYASGEMDANKIWSSKESYF